MVSRSDAIKELSQHASDGKFLQSLRTEAATKNALVMPFIRALGYNIFDPQEVVPEFTADVGTKQGEKVDYAIMISGSPMMIFECKKVSDPLDVSRVSQLIRYFNSTDAEVGVLTNGVVYKFFGHVDKENIMDETPFMVIDLTKPDAREFGELDAFGKDAFDPEAIKSSASSMKYIRDIKGYLTESYNRPDEDFVELLARKALPKGVSLTQRQREQFKDLTKRAFADFIEDMGVNLDSLSSHQPSSVSDSETPNREGTPPQTVSELVDIENGAFERVRKQKRRNESWVNIRKGVLALQDKPHEPFGTRNVENTAKACVRRISKETSLSLAQIENVLDERGLGYGQRS